MGSNLLSGYVQVLNQLESYNNIPKDLINTLQSYKILVYRSYQQNSFTKPMPWIGIYIALASLFCTLAMVADLLHGLRNRKLWFPCKYFTPNAASLTVIAVAMKLPMELSNSMPGDVDQAAKLGSMAFMCTLMANFLPSLATMDIKELFTNIIALGVLVITLVVNVCIQIKTGVLSYYNDDQFMEVVAYDKDLSSYMNVHGNSLIATIHMVVLLMLLIIHICSSLAILKSKQILESKYQTGHERSLNELHQPGRLTVEKLKKLVSNYWIMAGTGSPQFVTACSATSSASGVICALTTVLHIFTTFSTIGSLRDFKSDYKWTMVAIFIIQFIGIVLGTIAPFSRCFAALSFKLSIEWIWNHVSVFKVEKYWTQKLSDWKQSSIPFPFSSRKFKIVTQNLKLIILIICIGFQKTVVVGCKMIGLIPIFSVISILYCFRCWKWLKAMLSATEIVLVRKPDEPGKSKDLGPYVLQLQDDMVLAERTLKRISKSMNRLIRKAEKEQPSNLMKLVEGSRGFEGVVKFDSHLVPLLLVEEPLSSWSLPVVTLTSIALSLPDIRDNIIDNFLRRVSEGIVYVTLVEESLNDTDDYVNIHKAARTLWLEVELHNKWLGYKLKKVAPHMNTTQEILEWFRDTSKNIVTEVVRTDIGGPNDDFICRSISANSMYRITETILLSYRANIDEVSQEELLVKLSLMIADILAACLTNLPKVIAMKCHVSEIEKREASVHTAAQLLGETTQIINTLQDREHPNLNPEEMPFIDKWRTYFNHPFP